MARGFTAILVALLTDYHRVYSTPMLQPSALRRKHDRQLLKQTPVVLNARQRSVVEAAVRETCTIRRWQLWTVNVRTNHVHAVVSATRKPEAVLTALKANSTRAMRESGCWATDLTPWSNGGSTKYLWSNEELTAAIAYVRDNQGKPLT